MRLAPFLLSAALLATASVVTAAPTFTDVTTSAGINHVQATATVIDNLPGPAFMTGGVAAGDFDGDGRTDLIFTRLNDADIFYRNQGDGTFEQRTTSAGFGTATLTNGIASGDIDNDGDLDLYMTTTTGTRNYLYLNDGNGVFTDTGTGRVAALSDGVPRYGQGVSFGDYDNDGYLDLFTSDWGSPVESNHSRLLRNVGGAQAGQFEDVTAAAGVDVYRQAGLPNQPNRRFTPRWVDLDQDGHLDLSMVSDFRTSQLFWNNGDGTFTDGTFDANVGTDNNGMGSTFADYDGDGDLDWFITNITNAPEFPGPFGGFNRLYRNDGDRNFTDVTQEAGVRDARWGWGTSFFDYDNDGDPDLAATNGYNGGGWVDDQTFLYENNEGVFTNVATAVGVTDTQQGRGLAHLDYDNDGDLDFVVINNEAAPVLYRNDGGTNHYLRVDVEGTASNRDGIGAWITVTPDLSDPDERLVWEIDGGSSFLSQNERTAHFGLGDSAEPIDLVTIRWSNGLVQHVFDVTADQTINVVETDQLTLADFNGDGTIDAADYTVWRDAAGGSADLRADASGNGIVGDEDLLLWHSHYGRSALAVTIPEPSAVWLAASCLPAFRRRRLS